MKMKNFATNMIGIVIYLAFEPQCVYGMKNFAD
jgi:hypothetical protein